MVVPGVDLQKSNTIVKIHSNINTKKKSTHLTLAAAVPLVATSGAHKLGLALFAALALRDVVLVELGTVSATAATGRDDHARFAAVIALVMAAAAGIVHVAVVVTVVVIALVNHQPVYAVLRFVVLESKMEVNEMEIY